MDNLPLDAPTEFVPTELDRPAGPWMKGYWAQTALWAKRFGYLCMLFFSWRVYSILNILIQRDAGILNLMKSPLVLLRLIPIPFLGIYAILFGQKLQSALDKQSQWDLEKAFAFLRNWLITGLITGVFWSIMAFSEWNSAISLRNTIIRYQETYEEKPSTAAPDSTIIAPSN